MEQVDSSWIQKGELGLAFAVVVLAAWLVVYVMKTSKAREDKLLELVTKFQLSFQIVAERLEDVSRNGQIMNDRLDSIDELVRQFIALSERTVRYETGNRRKSKRKANPNGNDREYKPE